MAKKKNKKSADAADGPEIGISAPSGDLPASVTASRKPSAADSSSRTKTPPQQASPASSALIICRNKYVFGFPALLSCNSGPARSLAFP